MKLLKAGLTAMGTIAAGAAFSLAAAQADASGGSVEVVFGDRIQANMNALDRIETQREQFFREHRFELNNGQRGGNAPQAFFTKTVFGNERVVPEIENFSLERFTAAMADYNFNMVENREPGHRLKVEIDNFYLARHSLAKFSSFNTRMEGRMSIVDAGGNEVRSVEVNTQILPTFTSKRAYDGPQHAYLTEAMDVRFGPILASFLEKGIEQLYPDADVPGPIFIRR